MTRKKPADKDVAGDSNLPRLLFGMELSYFTGKLEAVLRYKELPYERVLKGPIGEIRYAHQLIGGMFR